MDAVSDLPLPSLDHGRGSEAYRGRRCHCPQRLGWLCLGSSHWDGLGCQLFLGKPTGHINHGTIGWVLNTNDVFDFEFSVYSYLQPRKLELFAGQLSKLRLEAVGCVMCFFFLHVLSFDHIFPRCHMLPQPPKY